MANRLKKIWWRIRDFFDPYPPIRSHYDKVETDILNEYKAGEWHHHKRIIGILQNAGYDIVADEIEIDKNQIVQFKFRIYWDHLWRIEQRIRQGLPDRTMRERHKDEGRVVEPLFVEGVDY
jgi:hypothetical protein